jgi:hypothetical protein
MIGTGEIVADERNHGSGSDVRRTLLRTLNYEL